MKILVIGSINMDLTTYVDRLPTQGETKFGRSLNKIQEAKELTKLVPVL